MWLDVYQYRKAITIDHTKFGSGLTDFPLLVKLTDSNFDFSKSLTSGGLDIRFTDSDGDSLLKFEREFFGTVYGDTFCVDGTASASSIFGGSYTAPNAFDGNSSTVWESASGGGMPQWVKYDLGVGVTKIARQFSVMTWFADRNSPPTDFVLQGSNNDSSWTDLYTKTGETWTDAGPKFYQFANATAYRYYRLYVTATLGASYTSVKELQIMELVNEAYFWVKVPSISSTIDGTIYLYYGKSGDTDGQDASNTWDDFNKAIYHLQQSGNGTAGEFIDSKNSHDGHGAWDNSVGRTPILVDSHLDGAQYFNFAQEIIIPDNSDMELAEDDFTISFKTQFFSLSNAGLIWIGRYQGPSGYFYCGFELASGNNFRFRDFLGSSIDFLFAWTPIVGHYYDIEITRNGNLFTFYADGIQIATYSNSDALLDRTSDWQFGNVFGVVSSDNYAFNGIMDEIRWTVGLCRSDSWRDARIASDNDTVNTFENEEGFGISIAETVVIRENWNLETNPSEKAFSDTLSIQEAWFAFTNPVQKSISDTIKIADSWTVNAAGSVIKIFSTILNTVFRSVTLFATNLTLGQVQFIKYLTNLVTKVGINYTYNTDLRCKTTPFDIIAVGTLDDYSINLDGIPLNSKDVDFQSINITFNLNSTPSRAEMTLPRHHDNLNYKLDGSFSEITNENKIEIYDGSIKLFTGYVTQIFADSNKDVVTITVEDIRYKLALSSMQLEYGGDWLIDSNNNGIPDIDDNDHAVVNDPNYIRFEKSISKALDEVFLHIGVLISGHDAYPFSGTFVPEFVKTFDTYAALIDELLKNTANVNWYTDENEIVRFQVVAKGQIKTLDLSSINSHRHPYDTVINDIRLNKKQSNYATALNVKLGNHIIKFWLI